MATVDASVWVAALDPSDPFHLESLEFLKAAGARASRLHAPAFVLLEVGCATARRAGSASVGQEAVNKLEAHPTLTLHRLDDMLMRRSLALGLERGLRGADALYAAVAAATTSTLIAWDLELIARGGGETPRHWLDAGSP